MSKMRHLHTGIKVKRSLGERIIQVIIYLVLIAVCLLIVLPCLNVVALAFNDGKDAARGGVYFWPRMFTLENFQEVFKNKGIIRGYGITIARTVIGTFMSLLLLSLAAFALKEKQLPGRTFINFMIIFWIYFITCSYWHY